MARVPTTADAFNAIAEPRRRDILTLLRGDEHAVAELADGVGLHQSATSKHLRVLREVGLVYYRKEGRQRLYGLDARRLRPVHEWTGGFEDFWSGTFARLDDYVRELQQEEHDE